MSLCENCHEREETHSEARLVGAMYKVVRLCTECCSAREFCSQCGWSSHCDDAHGCYEYEAES